MFSGASALNLDAKGRIAMPTRFREDLRAQEQGKLVVTVDIQSPCLLIYPAEEWAKVLAKLLKLSDLQPQERAIKRLLLGYAQDCELDSNGRILLTPPLRQYAALDKKAMLVGQLNKFELWDEQTWQQQLADSLNLIQSDGLEASERLADFSL
ncbi:division/cell wall cluster transcriptional repressor MraZ [Shewanella yunxiaonensis]|uniref:Transcriptional regulator MraZ n=1 Tax=Shewanella yunxiaonensis TaxID=2829809 RepID=A0ABX7YUG7_9GAMM|nr:MULTISPECIES: division/cell wall cluster transcriptional repressor MraZ [Shewanella]MDF0535558.1 division/cell wall cluster transcriptional repressor MraZ [Shewanella sp. A32]QUN06128.1 division/cell wall cluster transcriptional repressor MraZ [Shewanella yunxiaonensis]